MKILVINAGSSTIKYQLFEIESETVLCSGLVEKIGESVGRITHKKFLDSGEETKTIVEEVFPTHKDGMTKMIDMMMNGETAVIFDVDEIKGVGHRVVHGGKTIIAPMRVDDDVLETLRNVIPLAPLHNPGAIMGIEEARKLFPHATHAIVVDTAFHQTMPAKAHVYPLPYELYENDDVRKYGFHGTSYQYVSAKAAEFLDKPLSECNFIVCHLGSGASMCAIQNGVSIDTSMGLSPLDGLMMCTRSGSIDPTVVGWLMRNKNMTIDQVDTLLTKKSGFLGVAGQNDNREVIAAANNGDKRAQLALDMFAYRTRGFIGSYMVQMPRVDAVLFTAGIGENSSESRAQILEGMERFGIALDAAKNGVRSGDVRDISAPNSSIKVLVVPTNEELEIARQTQRLL